jgi:hypothetical protein
LVPNAESFRDFFYVFDSIINKNTCRLNFIEIASSNQLFAKPTTLVSIGYRLGGGVMIDKSRAAIKEKVLGIGVAVNVNVSTLAAIVFNLSLH